MSGSGFAQGPRGLPSLVHLRREKYQDSLMTQGTAVRGSVSASFAAGDVDREGALIASGPQNRDVTKAASPGTCTTTTTGPTESLATAPALLLAGDGEKSGEQFAVSGRFVRGNLTTCHGRPVELAA